MESIRIGRFKTFLEQCFDEEPSCPFLFTITYVKNCVFYIDVSVEFALDSYVEISKFLKSVNKTENNGNTLPKLHRDTSSLSKVSRWNLSF